MCAWWQFNKLLAEREAALAEERKKAEERARQQAQMATLSKAATMLQKMWRGKVARRELDKKKSGKGGKGKKGKKKKVGPHASHVIFACLHRCFDSVYAIESRPPCAVSAPCGRGMRPEVLR